MKQIWQKHLQPFMHNWVWPVLVAVLVATSFKSAIADWNIVPTGSMKPTIVEGDRIFVNKLAYDLKVPYTTFPLAAWGEPQRGDIVVFYSPENEVRTVKRIIGLPGDTVTMHNNRLIINGKPVDYELPETRPKGDSGAFPLEEALEGRPHAIQLQPIQFSKRSFAPIIVPDHQYFVMGDNRDNSKDSRYFGCVERRRIVGRATAVVISLEKQNAYRPRWDRFFSKLQ